MSEVCNASTFGTAPSRSLLRIVNNVALPRVQTRELQHVRHRVDNLSEYIYRATAALFFPWENHAEATALSILRTVGATQLKEARVLAHLVPVGFTSGSSLIRDSMCGRYDPGIT